MITEDQLKKFCPNGKDIPLVVKWFNEYADSYKVNTPLRIAAFFAQVIHESAAFHYTKEIASGKAYEGRIDLGNVQAGDGVKFKGRGLIQITGRNNYRDLSQSFFNDDTLLNQPELLEQYPGAMHSAFWFWDKRHLNDYADRGYLKTITKKINGGLNGWPERLNNYNRICDVLGLPHWTE